VNGPKFGRICTFVENSYLLKRVNTSNIIYWGKFLYFKEFVAKENLQKIFFMKKVQMLRKGPL
jgi:hypothetical protein